MSSTNKKSLFFLIVYLCFILSGCWKKDTTPYAQVISEVYAQSGLNGEVTIEQVKGQGFLYSTPYTRVVFNYSEKVNNRDITVSDTFFFKYKTTELEEEEKVEVSHLEDFQGYSGIVQSFAFQEEVQILTEKIEAELNKKIVIDHFNLKKVEPYLMTFQLLKPQEEIRPFAESFSEYKKEVLENQQADKPFQGYYDIDVKKYMANGLILLEISYENLSKELFPEDKKELVKTLEEKLQELDVSDFYDGVYRLSFDTVTKDGGRTGGESYTFHVKEKKISYFAKNRV